MCSQAVVTADRGAQGGAGLVMREWTEGWIIKSMRLHGPKVVICEMFFSAQRTPLIRMYPPPPQSTIDHLTDLEKALNLFLGRNPILMGDLNEDIGYLQNPWNQLVEDFLASFGLVDLLDHFRQRLCFFHMQTW